jgi:hypothetical protein
MACNCNLAKRTQRGLSTARLALASRRGQDARRHLHQLQTLLNHTLNSAFGHAAIAPPRECPNVFDYAVCNGHQEVFRKAFYALRRAWPAHGCCQSLDFLKTLILFDDIEPLLRLAIVPDVEFSHLYAFPEYSSPQHGWNDIKHSALIAYVGLNMLFAKPELYDPTGRTHKLEEFAEKYGYHTHRTCSTIATRSRTKRFWRTSCTRDGSSTPMCARFPIASFLASKTA